MKNKQSGGCNLYPEKPESLCHGSYGVMSCRAVNSAAIWLRDQLQPRDGELHTNSQGCEDFKF